MLQFLGFIVKWNFYESVKLIFIFKTFSNDLSVTLSERKFLELVLKKSVFYNL